MKKPASKTKNDSKIFYSVAKVNMQLYQLLKIELFQDGSYEVTKLHEDIPPIVYGKMLGLIKNQEIKLK